MYLWTKEKPKKPGWYWMRPTGSRWYEPPHIVKIRLYTGQLCIMNWPIPDKAIWAGPIHQPKIIKRRREVKKK